MLAGMAKKPPDDPQIQFLVMSLTDLVVQMIEQKCEKLSKRDRGTLQRRILKAVQLFVAPGRGGDAVHKKEAGRSRS